MDFIKSALRSAAADYAQEMGVPRAVFDHIFPLDDENGNEYDPPTPPNEIHVPNSQQQHYGPTVYGEDGEEKQPLHYKLSQATGKRKAVLVGCNYPGSIAPLEGCGQSFFNVIFYPQLPLDYFGYEETNIRVLTDSESSHGEIGEALSTRENIVGYIRWLVEDAEPDDSLFFHSTMVSNQKDLDGDEYDGMDESICPTHYETAGVLVDDELHDLLVKPLPEGAGLTALFDSCHSGSVLDLPWTYETSGAIKEPDDLQGEAEAEAVAIDAHQKRFKWSPADVISLSGCRDSQTSADAQFGGLPSGALSYAFIRAFAKFPQMTYAQLLKVIRNELRGKFDQRPQLSSSHPIDMDLLFIQ
ncbi:ICE-like protease (caspase) p20 domain protein [Rhizoctonia solani]|uniref:ICE-like protease (Caspase) p20 domain protein n=1 Tax=Rhizoctonia solani TaxID=456999 RepID=A0A8H8SS60_9AGAM|nr:ICE-like protease (caspase) p20 domain protein [Rhizoctonia solani]QRW16466.1 ICE-like protease (caspase) p20 domain protein [Rhizoctonia solani]